MKFFHPIVVPDNMLKHRQINDGSQWLHRRSMLLPENSWKQLKRIALIQQRTESQVLANLLNLASVVPTKRGNK